MGNQASAPPADIPFPAFIPPAITKLPITEAPQLQPQAPPDPTPARVQPDPVQVVKLPDPGPVKTSARRMREIVQQYGLIPLTLTETWQLAPQAIKDEFSNGETVDYTKIEPDPSFWVEIIEKFKLLNDPHPAARALIQDFYQKQVTMHHKKAILSEHDRQQFFDKMRTVLQSNPKLDAFLRGTYAGGDASHKPEPHFLLFDVDTDLHNIATYSIVSSKDFFTYVSMYDGTVYEIIDDVLVYVPSVKHAKDLIVNDVEWSFGEAVSSTAKDIAMKIPIVSGIIAKEDARVKRLQNPTVFYDRNGKIITEGHNDPINLHAIERTPELLMPTQPNPVLQYGFEAAAALAGAFILRSLFR